MSRAAKKAKTAANGSKAGDWVGDINGLGMATKLVHGGVDPDPISGAILTPIVQSTTFVQESIDKYLAKGFSYSRTANPTVRALENKIAVIEGGVGTACFTTGMAATCTVFTAFLKAGDHCILTDCSYGGTNRAARVVFQDLGVEFSFVDCTKVENVKKAIKPNTKLVFTETPANPVLTLNDIEEISKVCKTKKLIHCVDSTFGTPLMHTPLKLGADLTLISTTKFYDGHNMTVGGAVVCKTQEHLDRVRFIQNVHGNLMSPFVAFLQLQTVKTLELRIQRQSATAQKVAEFLEKHPAVETVTYPGLESFKQRELAKKQHNNNMHGSMLAFEVKGGTANGRKLMDTINRPWSLCENLGATESIITCPAVMTHANMLKEDRLKVGITDGFVRVSCGIEDADDLIAALKKALDALQ